jgi:hypothetical protein
MENITCVNVCLYLGPFNTGLKYMQTAHKVVRSDKHIAMYALFSKPKFMFSFTKDGTEAYCNLCPFLKA